METGRRTPKLTNKNRARWAAMAMNRYRDVTASSGPHDEYRIRNLMQDILCWMARQRPPELYPDPVATLREACDMACRGFAAELMEDALRTLPIVSMEPLTRE